MDLENKVRGFISQKKFVELEHMLSEVPDKELDEVLSKIAFDDENLIMYSLVCMLLIKKETAGLHYIAAQLVMHPLCFIEGAYIVALYHVRKGIKLDPVDKGLKEVLIFLHEVPEQVVSKEEAISVAKELLMDAPNNSCAKRLLSRYDA